MSVSEKTAIKISPADHVEQAYLQLCWSLKMRDFLYKHEIVKSEFDGFFSFSKTNISIPAGQFNTMDDLLSGADNCVHTCLALLFISLDRALSDACVQLNPKSETYLGQLRILVYMCRCAFAHNAISPCWEVHASYCRSISIPELSLVLDLRTIAGCRFDLTQIGGYSGLFRIVDEVKKCLKKKVPV